MHIGVGSAGLRAGILSSLPRVCLARSSVPVWSGKTSLWTTKGQLPLVSTTHKHLLSTSSTVFQDSLSETKTTPNVAPHFKRNLGVKKENETSEKTMDYLLPHPIWSEDEVQKVTVTHREPEKRADKLAYYTVQLFRLGFDNFSGFNFGKRTESKWLRRVIFLETVAGVPGMVGGMLRHLRSLRRMERDHGWIHTLLEEAENERMHLMTALDLKKPSKLFTFMVLGAQGIFVNIFFIAYLLSPMFCHRFVGYLEEEAVITYTKLIEEIDNGTMAEWQNKSAPEIATKYWKLGPDAMMRDVILAIRADEAHHRDVNHTLGTMKMTDQNPFGPGQ